MTRNAGLGPVLFGENNAVTVSGSVVNVLVNWPSASNPGSTLLSEAGHEVRVGFGLVVVSRAADSGEKRAGAAKDVMSTVVMLLKV